MYGVTVAGCPETFESPQQSEEGTMRSERFSDRHQRVGLLKQGDVVAIRAGDPHWAYNNGEEDLVVVVLQDNSNNANQLDQNPRVRPPYRRIFSLVFHQRVYIYMVLLVFPLFPSRIDQVLYNI